ncbi:hypothetical protein BMF94_3817 [Rhodotorula taiwanensis]|uniref:Uncharacterized protein n=1 Tax=Rhodotorula taiwanensis TaxID=741276 RepID=A0A2S5B8M1_9BASI|nr:hypothetical protein BMF94_3817 [Rhodotorula taiwanensis]
MLDRARAGRRDTSLHGTSTRRSGMACGSSRRMDSLSLASEARVTDKPLFTPFEVVPTEEADRLEQEAARLARQNKGKRGYKQEAQKRKEARRSIWDGKRFVGSIYVYRDGEEPKQNLDCKGEPMRRRGITTAKRWSYEEDAALMDLVGQEVAPNWQAKVYALARMGFPRRSKDDVQKKGEAMLAEGDDSLDILEESRLRTKAFSAAKQAAERRREAEKPPKKAQAIPRDYETPALPPLNAHNTARPEAGLVPSNSAVTDTVPQPEYPGPGAYAADFSGESPLQGSMLPSETAAMPDPAPMQDLHSLPQALVVTDSWELRAGLIDVLEDASTYTVRLAKFWPPQLMI